MENLNLNAQIRNSEEKLKDLRASKMVAGIVYGKHQEPILLKMDNSDFLRTFRKSWENHIINLQIEKKNFEVLVHEVQKEPINWDFLHVDFYAITRGEKVHTKMPLKFVWVSKAVKEWAILDEHMKEIEVKVLPKDLVDFIEVDISELKEMWDSIRLSELKIDSSKIEVLTPDEVVVSATKPAKVEAVEETTTEEVTTEEK